MGAGAFSTITRANATGPSGPVATPEMTGRISGVHASPLSS